MSHDNNSSRPRLSVQPVCSQYGLTPRFTLDAATRRLSSLTKTPDLLSLSLLSMSRRRSRLHACTPCRSIPSASPCCQLSEICDLGQLGCPIGLLLPYSKHAHNLFAWKIFIQYIRAVQIFEILDQTERLITINLIRNQSSYSVFKYLFKRNIYKQGTMCQWENTAVCSAVVNNGLDSSWCK